MKATSRFAPSASSPWSVELPSASTCSARTRSPRPTIGFWWISVPWFERMNFVIGYSCFPSLVVDHDPLGVHVDDGARPRRRGSTSPVSIAARYSRPVPTSGACVIISGTACRCMFAPISARFASLCSRNGISAVATDTIWAGATSMKSTSFGRAVTASPSRERQSTCSSTKRPVFSSTCALAWAIVYCASSAASR